MYRRLARFDIPPEEALLSQLQQKGYRPSDITHVVLSHLHQDHIGGIQDLQHATFVVSRREWQDMSKPLPEIRGFLRRHIDLPGLNWERVEFNRNSNADDFFAETHDLFGDGSMVLLPTPGHTPGSISMYVSKPDSAPLLMVGDLTYSVALLKTGQIPGVGQPKPFHRTTSRIRAFMAENPSVKVLPAHDPDVNLSEA
jgi:glyoxylase-like metal-dependent hydrolase (beta-lactamase superfamily II)